MQGLSGASAIMTVDDPEVSPMVRRAMKHFHMALRIRRLEDAMRDAIEAIERGSSSAPVVEALKAVLNEAPP